MLRIKNLAGVFTGRGFRDKRGRHPTLDDCGFVSGPVEIICDPITGTIAEIERTGFLSTYSCEKEIDGTDLIATAGFLDSHTHAIHAGNRAEEYFLRWAGTSYKEIAQRGGGIHRTVADTNFATDEELARLLKERLDQMLRYGTTVVEVKSGYADSPEGELRLLRVVRQVASRRTAPEIRATFLGLHAIPRGYSEQEYCSRMIGILRTVVSENLAAFVDTFPERGFFSLEQSLRFARAARKHGLGIKVHADQFSDFGVSTAYLKEKAVSIDHLEYVAPTAINLLASSNTVATLLPVAAFFLNSRYANARRLIDSGARVALASDFNPGTAPCASLQLCALLAASKMKMTPPEILCGLTYNAAGALKLDKTHGLLKPGYRANVLLWQPSSKPGTLLLEEIIVGMRTPSEVIIAGRRMPR